MKKIEETELKKVQGGAGPKSTNMPQRLPDGDGGGSTVGEPDGGNKIPD